MGDAPFGLLSAVRTKAVVVFWSWFPVVSASDTTVDPRPLVQIASGICISHESDQALLEGLSVKTPPTIAAALPPTSSHTVLSVGAPVNTRDTLELTESDALIP